MTRRVAVDGRCADQQGVVASARAARWSDITESAEHVVVAVDEEGAITLASSAAGLVEHVHSRRAGELEHDATIAGVVARSGWTWEWDHAAVADVLVFGHPLGDRTLHRDVARLRGGTVVRLGPTGPEVDDPPAGNAGRSDDRTSGPVTPALALERLVDAVGRCAGAELSISGGLDSRLVLAAMLADGQRPLLRVSGRRGCADRDIAAEIARRFGLELHATEISESDVVTAVDGAATATNGLVPAPALAGRLHLGVSPPDGGAPVVLGINGELARSFDASSAGWRSATQSLLPAAAFPRWFRQGSRRPLSSAELDAVAPELRAALDPAAIESRLRATGGRSATALGRADEFYRFQHLQRFGASDMAAVALHTNWAAPFADTGWMDAVTALPRRWLTGDRFHRWAIGQLAPELLDVARVGDRRPLGARPPRTDWFSGPAPERGPHYLPQAMFWSGPLLDLLIERRSAIEDLMSPELVARLVAEQQSSGLRPHLVFSLLAIASHRVAVERAAADQRRIAPRSPGAT
jgi:asparagine synthase (glutamine-hydrolysing)